jgi:hypothetical protein
MNDPLLPYVAQAPWYIRIFGLLAFVILVIILWPAPTPAVFEIWQQSTWLFRIVMVIGLIVLPSGAAGLLFEKNVFTETWMEHRTGFLRRIVKPYSDIQSMEYTAPSWGHPESLKIIFSDSSKISIMGGQANLQRVIQILKTRTDKPVYEKSRKPR